MRTATTVSIYALLASPERFAGKEVLVSGVLRISDERERAALYVDKGSMRNRVAANGVLLPNLSSGRRNDFVMARGLTLRSLDGRYVRISGVVAPIDYPSDFAVEVTHISQLLDYPLIKSPD